jgi:hypothetical protein
LHVVSARKLFLFITPHLWINELDLSGHDWHAWKNINGQTENMCKHLHCKGTVGPEASNLLEAEGVRLKLLKLLELTGNPKR